MATPTPDETPEAQPYESCTAPGCTKPTRLYAGGYRCEDHMARAFTSDILGQDPRERS